MLVANMLDIKARENEIKEYWEAAGIDDLVRKKNSGGKKFYFLDGPPYVTGELAAHHIWVETILLSDTEGTRGSMCMTGLALTCMVFRLR
jgi:valyl-tRNA synthetase